MIEHDEQEIEQAALAVVGLIVFAVAFTAGLIAGVIAGWLL